MHFTLLLPGALLPREVVRALKEPLSAVAFGNVLARAHLVGDTDAQAPAHLAWIAEHLFQRDAPLATAPYAYAALTENTPGAEQVLWHADPVHLELARDHLVLTPLADAPASDEADALIAAANALAAEAGLEFVRVEDRWFARASREWAVETAPLAGTIGRPLPAVLPAGRDAAMWNRLLTEIQMSWHAHPVNEAREARGSPTINSLWLHGGGRWAALPAAGWSSVQADEPEFRGAARAAGVTATSTQATPGDGALVVRSDLLAARLMQDWSGWVDALRRLDQSLMSIAHAHALDLILTGETTLRRLQIRPSDRLKFWRAASLEQVLSE